MNASDHRNQSVDLHEGNYLSVRQKHVLRRRGLSALAVLTGVGCHRDLRAGRLVVAGRTLGDVWLGRNLIDDDDGRAIARLGECVGDRLFVAIEGRTACGGVRANLELGLLLELIIRIGRFIKPDKMAR